MYYVCIRCLVLQQDFVPLTCKEEDTPTSSEAVLVEGSRKRKHGEMEVENAKKPKLEEGSKDIPASIVIKKDTGPLRVISKLVGYQGNAAISLHWFVHIYTCGCDCFIVSQVSYAID